MRLRANCNGIGLALIQLAQVANFKIGENVTMKKNSLVLASIFAIATLPVAFGQSTTSPSQQTPTEASPTQAPGTSDPSTAAPSGNPSDAQRAFVGSIRSKSGKFVLHTGGTDYELDDQAQAKKFDGKDVKVTGQLDSSSNTIHVQSIDPATSM
ncbi:MAG: hypothetical protein HY010_11245 [Acidobacteria bacterium]|nr:hypothetical protein [Acidobacteriota bacterium]